MHLNAALMQAFQPLMSSTSSLESSGEPPAIPVHWVEDLFARLGAILGAKFADAVGTGDIDLVKREWSQALVDFSAREVQRGLAACRTRKFAPNLGEFLHLCRPALDPELAWLEAERGLKAHGAGQAFEWSHPAVYWTAADMALEIRSTSFATQRKRWESLLGIWFAQRKWPAIPDPTARRIEHQQQALPADKARVVEQLRTLRAKLTGHQTRAEQDAAMKRAEHDAPSEPMVDA